MLNVTGKLQVPAMLVGKNFRDADPQNPTKPMQIGQPCKPITSPPVSELPKPPRGRTTRLNTRQPQRQMQRQRLLRKRGVQPLASPTELPAVHTQQRALHRPFAVTAAAAQLPSHVPSPVQLGWCLQTPRIEMWLLTQDAARPLRDRHHHRRSVPGAPRQPRAPLSTASSARQAPMWPCSSIRLHVIVCKTLC